MATIIGSEAHVEVLVAAAAGWEAPVGALAVGLIAIILLFIAGARGGGDISLPAGLALRAYGSGGTRWLVSRQNGVLVNALTGAALGFTLTGAILFAIALITERPAPAAAWLVAGSFSLALSVVMVVRHAIVDRRGLHTYAMIDTEARVVTIPTDPTGSPQDGIHIPADAIRRIDTPTRSESRASNTYGLYSALRVHWATPTGFERRAILMDEGPAHIVDAGAEWLRSSLRALGGASR